MYGIGSYRTEVNYTHTQYIQNTTVMHIILATCK